MEKVVFLLYGSPDGAAGDALRVRLLDDVAPALVAEPEVHALSVLVHDTDAAAAPSPAPGPADEATHVAEVSLWVDCYQRRAGADEALGALGLDVGAYLVVESLYEDYGSTPHGGPRDWPDGQRSPGVLTVARIHRPADLTMQQWLEAWHEGVSSVSARLQPRTRYVRNRVVQLLTPEAPITDGIVEEAWPSAQHVADPMLFFGTGGDPAKLGPMIEEMTAASAAALDMDRLRITTMSEYLVRSF